MVAPNLNPEEFAVNIKAMREDVDAAWEQAEELLAARSDEGEKDLDDLDELVTFTQRFFQKQQPSPGNPIQSYRYHGNDGDMAVFSSHRYIIRFKYCDNKYRYYSLDRKKQGETH